MDVKTETIAKAGPTLEEIAAHVLEPGECVWLLDLSAPDPQSANPVGWGVVVKSASNTDQEVEVRIGDQPTQMCPRTALRWMGPWD